MKIALSIGHSPQDGGAVSTDGKWSEYGFWKEHISKVKEELERLGHVAVVCNRSEAGGITPTYAARACNATGANLAVEFHFNSAGSGATGTETLCWLGSKGARAAELIQRAMCGVLGLPDRGVKFVGSPEDNAYSFFKKTSMPAILVEPAFAGSNVTDCDRLEERVSELCVAVAGAIDEFFKGGAV